MYRDLERIGANSIFILENYQNILKKYGLVSNKQFLDFSSSYFEGNNSDLGALGYSRDNEPGKKQLTFGVITGINNIPTALTVQKGNVQDKKHFKYMLRVVRRVLPIGSLLIFDCGANTKENKEEVMKDNLNYLTLKPKKREVYARYIRLFKEQPEEKILINDTEYECVKIVEGNEVQYIFFSAKLA